MRKLLNKIIASRNRTSSIGVGGEQSVALCLNLRRRVTGGGWLTKKTDKSKLLTVKRWTGRLAGGRGAGSRGRALRFPSCSWGYPLGTAIALLLGAGNHASNWA